MPRSNSERAFARRVRAITSGNVKESVEQSRSRARLDAVGFVVMNASQARASGIEIGFADTYAVHPDIGVAVFVESKRSKGGVLSPMQEQFAAVHDAAHMAAIAREERGDAPPIGMGVPATIIGDVVIVDRFLIRCGLAELTPGGAVVLKPRRCAVYYAWHRVKSEERERRKLARQIKRSRGR